MFQALSFIGAQVFTLEQSQVFAVSRICHNMRKSGYRDQEITLVLKALYITTTRQDVREAWWVINRRHLAEIPRPDFLSTLLDIFGPEARAAIVNILDRQARRPRMALGGDGRIVLGGGGAGGSADGSADQMIGFQEFAAMMPQLAKDVATERVADFVAREAKELAESAATGMHSMLTELQVIEPSLTSKIPPAALPRAGAITERMLAAGYTQRQANNAISALFVSRDQRALVRLWGSFDRARAGNISTETFDRAMLMFSDCLLPEQLPELRAQLGFVQPGQVTLREFEAALRLLVPKDGSPPDLRKIQSKVMLADLLGGPGNVDRLQSFQRQRVARLAQRMHNFGYDPPAMVMVCRTLFLTKLHNKDLWTMWRFFSRGRTETPLTLTQTRHLLALLSEDESSEKLDALVKRVDADDSGSVEFDEFAVLLRAINPQAIRQTDVEAITFESHPLVQQVLQLQRDSKLQLMYAPQAQAEAQNRRAAALRSVMARLDEDTKDGNDGKHSHPQRWKQTLRLLKEVGRLQHEAALLATERGNLQDYCADAYADHMHKLSQASEGAVEMLEHHDLDSYEAHVALRTVRTLEAMERVLPAQQVDWAHRAEQLSSVPWTVDVSEHGAKGGGAKGSGPSAMGAARWQSTLRRGQKAKDVRV